MSIANAQRGFGPVLNNKPFRRLWAAQWMAQTAQNTTNFILIVLIERLTGASIHQGLMILAFTLPGVIFAPISGVIIDRWPKKYVLVGSNALRVAAVMLYLLVLTLFRGNASGWVLFLLYSIAFIMATIGQLFNPAETATIPLLVGREHLMAANSLFNLTLALSQVVGLVILGPLAVKLIGITNALIMVAGMYGAAAWLVSRLPRDEPARQPAATRTGWQRAKAELKEGAEFVVKRPPILVSMTYLTLIASLVMVMAMLAPGISSRVLHLAPEDAIVVFAPAGIGMLVAAVLLGRWGYRMQKQRLAQFGLLAMVFGFGAFGWIAWRFQATNPHLALDATMLSLPPASAALILATIFLSLFLGLAMSGVNIVSQTSLQENTPEGLRGRVFSVQFMLNNLVGIPPMLAIGALADQVGIPQILLGVAVVILLIFIVTTYVQIRYQRQSIHEDEMTMGRAVYVSSNGARPRLQATGAGSNHHGDSGSGGDLAEAPLAEQFPEEAWR